jgi:hypothetical protein
MADLKSTVTITGVVNGKKFNYVHEWAVEDVYDVGRIMMDSHDAGYSSSGTSSKAYSYEQDCPSYLMAANASTGVPGAIALTNEGASKEFYLILQAGQFVILGESANGDGIMTTNATDTTTSIESISEIKATTIGGVVAGGVGNIFNHIKASFLIAFQAST